MGKGTIVSALLKRFPDLWLSVSTTTRPARSGEVNGRDYEFCSRSDFKSVASEGGFLESFEVFGYLYGTPRKGVIDHLAGGTDVLLEIDVKGALAVREAFPDAILIFISPPSRTEQRQRLIDRGRDDLEVIDQRLALADAEEAQAGKFDAVITNDDLFAAISQVTDILVAHRAGGCD